ncbi:MAG: exo-beta-N-acetylmuramidase NamZ family protein [Bacteriovoracaceae bacterium]
MVRTGLENLLTQKSLQESLKGNIALLCHAASIDSEYTLSAVHFKNLFKDRFIKLFGPQHGFVTDVQDNMIETEDYIHPYFQIPVYSLYSKVRWPTEKMLENVDTFVIDLQDIGSRVYTYIWTVSYIIEKCENQDIEVVILDRPNPLDGVTLEGTILDKEYSSFVGRDEILHRHGLTMGEFAHWYKKKHNLNTKLRVIEMTGWKRDQYFHETGLPWVNPSPNIPLVESAYVFPATVMLEGTNLSEGRGITRPLEVIGHPSIEPFSFLEEINKLDELKDLKGFNLRPLNFYPMFQKHKESPVGGFHIQITNLKEFRPWGLGQLLIREFRNKLGSDFKWKTDAYEYEFDKLAIDLINGHSNLREMIESNASLDQFIQLEKKSTQNWKQSSFDSRLYT